MEADAWRVRNANGAVDPVSLKERVCWGYGLPPQPERIFNALKLVSLLLGSPVTPVCLGREFIRWAWPPKAHGSERCDHAPLVTTGVAIDQQFSGLTA
jgi:hypothetical protein